MNSSFAECGKQLAFEELKFCDGGFKLLKCMLLRFFQASRTVTRQVYLNHLRVNDELGWDKVMKTKQQQEPLLHSLYSVMAEDA